MHVLFPVQALNNSISPFITRSACPSNKAHSNLNRPHVLPFIAGAFAKIHPGEVRL